MIRRKVLMPLVTEGASKRVMVVARVRTSSEITQSPSPWVNDHLRVNGLQCGTHARCMAMARLLRMILIRCPI